jgi:hypothetical protein
MVVTEEQKAMVDLLKSMKAALDRSTETQEKLMAKVESQQAEIDELKRDVPEFLTEYSGKRASPKKQEDILSLVSELLLLDEKDRPEFLSDKSIRDFKRREGVESVGDIAARLLYRAHMNDIPLRYPIQWIQDEADDKW